MPDPAIVHTRLPHCDGMVAWLMSTDGTLPPVKDWPALRCAWEETPTTTPPHTQGRGDRPRKAYQKQPIPATLRWAVFERDNFTCQHCGVRRLLTADHRVAEVRGGPTTLENLQTLCQPCNSRKGSR